MSGSDLVAFWVGIQENATGQKIKSTNLSGKTLFLCEKTDLRLITIIIEMQKKKKIPMTLQVPFLPFKFFSLTEHFLENL
jgi:hypothetical protein